MSKHAFILPNRHAFGVVAAVVKNNYCSPADLYVYYDKENFNEKSDNFSILPELTNAYDVAKLKEHDCTSYDTISCVSLVPKSAKYIDQLLHDGVKKDNIWIHCTDDEVNRWRLLYDRLFGNFIPSRRYQIDDTMIRLFKILNNFHIEYEPYGKHLERIFNRDLNISGYVVYRPEKEKSVKSLENKTNDDGISISIDTKPSGFGYLIKHLILFLIGSILTKKNDFYHKKIKLFFWPNTKWSNKRKLTIKYLVNIIKFSLKNKTSLDTVSNNVMPYKDYLRLYANIDFVIRKTRGGGAGLMAAIENGGIVLDKKSKKYKSRLYNYYGKDCMHQYRTKQLPAIYKKIFKGEFESQVRVEKSLEFYNKYRKERDSFFKNFYT